MENIEYIFKCGNDTLLSCHGEHRVTTDDVLNCIFTILINKNKLKQEEITETIVNEYFLKVKKYMDILTDDMFSHFTSIQIELEIAIGFMEQ